ncbi:hypothetical protein IO49_04515 [Gallibacterium anatis]|nr:hypothetical protein IO49_04515 [Gallibacterium anatis]
MRNDYLIIINPETGKRETSYVIGISAPNYDKANQMAWEQYPNYLYLEDDGTLQQQLVDQNKLYIDGKVVDAPPVIIPIKQQQDVIWKRIKAERYKRTHSGVYIASVEKWFHTDEPSRQQYTFMRTLPVFETLNWKTMDGTFVEMDKTLLDKLSLEILKMEQANFANAEQHRLAMLASDDPENYDYSTGWSEIYAAE